MPGTLTEEEAQDIVQQVVEYAEGRLQLDGSEVGALGLLLATQWPVLAPALIELCGSTEAAMEKLALMRDLVEMGVPPTATAQ